MIEHSLKQIKVFETKQFFCETKNLKGGGNGTPELQPKTGEEPFMDFPHRWVRPQLRHDENPVETSLSLTHLIGRQPTCAGRKKRSPEFHQRC